MATEDELRKKREQERRERENQRFIEQRARATAAAQIDVPLESNPFYQATLAPPGQTTGFESAIVTAPPYKLPEIPPEPPKVIKPLLPKKPPRPNPLLEYATYTYGLSLHILPPDVFNKLANDPSYVYKPVDDRGRGRVLIASAGRKDQRDFGRHARFVEDFYFDNLKFTTVVGMNSKNRNSNSLEVKFTIIEPYGVSLIDRLLGVADDLEVKSWMQMPFMLQIDFFGNNDLGEIVHPIKGQTKYIPIRLIAMKIKITSRGSEYQISAVPFNHQAFTENNSSTPANFEIQATTVKDFFSASSDPTKSDAFVEVLKLDKERREALLQELKKAEYQTESGKRKADAIRKASAEISSGLPKQTYIVGSYAAAMNNYQFNLYRDGVQEFPDSYEFVFDEEFANSKIVIPPKTDIKRTPMSKEAEDVIRALRQQAIPTVAGPDLTKERFTINAGTSIVEVINMVMTQTEFIRNQLKDPAVEPATEKFGQPKSRDKKEPLIWYKIVPKINLYDFDHKRNVYKKHITFYVKKHYIWNTKFRDAPQSQPDTYAKDYQYIYTGKNDSILDFNIEFDTLFYTAITADRGKFMSTAIQAEDRDPDKVNIDPNKVARNSVQISVTHPLSTQANNPNPASVDSKGVLVKDFSQSLLSSSRGDMITVKLKIIGDPEFIKQDDLYTNPSNNPTVDVNELVDTKTNSLIFDAKEIFARLIFFTPWDLDLETGLYPLVDSANAKNISVFSGLYKVILVENSFEKGQFTQNLELVRLFNQPDYDTLEGRATVNDPNSQNRQPEKDTISRSQSYTDPSSDPNMNPNNVTGIRYPTQRAQQALNQTIDAARRRSPDVFDPAKARKIDEDAARARREAAAKLRQNNIQ